MHVFAIHADVGFLEQQKAGRNGRVPRVGCGGEAFLLWLGGLEGPGCLWTVQTSVVALLVTSAVKHFVNLALHRLLLLYSTCPETINGLFRWTADVLNSISTDHIITDCQLRRPKASYSKLLFLLLRHVSNSKMKYFCYIISVANRLWGSSPLSTGLNESQLSVGGASLTVTVPPPSCSQLFKSPSDYSSFGSKRLQLLFELSFKLKL